MKKNLLSKSLMYFFFLIELPAMLAASSGFGSYPVYNGMDLGLTYSSNRSVFKVFAPDARGMRVLLYHAGRGGEAFSIRDMEKTPAGVWQVAVEGDLLGSFYAFQALYATGWSKEVADPYVRAVGVNGQRGAVISLEDTNPEGWAADKRPELSGFEDIILYETQIRDMTGDISAGNYYPGQYKGMVQANTLSPDARHTGLDHLRQLGVTHVHLMPAFDFKSIDESLPRNQRPYNWGYDPQHYNVPEGSFSSDPFTPATRIKEFKEMVLGMHRAGLRVVMDVVYNHTGDTENSLFNQLAPGYYYRQTESGGFSNASACGNEIASERPMVRKFIVESVVYWATEYHVDGFRFDLMGIHDLETMRQIRQALDQVDPTIFIYGEGWTAGSSPLPDSLRALKQNTWKMDRIAAFSDEFRDGMRGHVFTPTDTGFISGKPGLRESIKFGIVGAVYHPQINYDAVNYAHDPWATHPTQAINYVSCHDNHTLWDRLALSAGKYPANLRMRMQRLALAMVLTSQGVPFLHAGSDFLRTKQGVENSFESPDSINLIDWSLKEKNYEIFEYVQALIRLRKAHPAFRMGKASLVQNNIGFLDHPNENVVVYAMMNHPNGDSWKHIMVIFNGSPVAQGVAVPPINWTIAVNVDTAHPEGLGSFKAYNLLVPAFSAVVMFSQDELPAGN